MMWSENGAKTLPLVLKRISEVNARALVFNEGKSIIDGENAALKCVTPEYFISFEQDHLGQGSRR